MAIEGGMGTALAAAWATALQTRLTAALTGAGPISSETLSPLATPQLGDPSSPFPFSSP